MQSITKQLPEQLLQVCATWHSAWRLPKKSLPWMALLDALDAPVAPRAQGEAVSTRAPSSHHSLSNPGTCMLGMGGSRP